MSSPIVSSPGGPIIQVPYDILMEIFILCLPRHRSADTMSTWHQRQPNTKVPPILLCHICSSWRRLVLESAALWTHLSYPLTTIQEYYTPNPGLAFTFGLSELENEFIRWWKINQRQIAPSLSIQARNWWRMADAHQSVVEGSGEFFLEYVTSAQYLELDIFFWQWIFDMLEAGHPVVFSNLHTILINIKDNGSQTSLTNPFYQLQTLLPVRAFPELRRLSITDNISSPDFAIPAHWSTLTHLSLHISITLPFWLSLIRAAPGLQFGYFEISIGTQFPLFHIATHTPPPCPLCILPELTTLSISVRCTFDFPSAIPLSVLFMNLHLPSLYTLSLSTLGAIAWNNYRALREVYSVLRSAPAVKKLALEYTNVWRNFDTRTLALLPETEPVWAHATELVHLQLALPRKFMEKTKREEVLDLFVRHIFSDSIWLDLRNPACPIRAITISDSGLKHPISDLTMSSVRESAEKVPKVTFEITLKSACQVAADVRKEWGLRI